METMYEFRDFNFFPFSLWVFCWASGEIVWVLLASLLGALG